MRRYSKRLTDRDVLQLLRDGVYYVDIEHGVALSQKMRPLATEQSRTRKGGELALFVRMYFDNCFIRKIALARLVWIAATKRTIPKGFQVHHRDTDFRNNRWQNLFCLYKLDHRKLHDGEDLISKNGQTEEEDF